MRYWRWFVLLLSLPIVFSACATTQAGKQGKYAKDIEERKLELPHCPAPIATIVAKGFKCKAAQCRGDRLVFSRDYTISLSPEALGDGLADMLVTALSQTGCFNVLEREALKEVKEELEMLGVQPSQTLKGADLLLTGAITSLELQAGGIGGGGIVVPLPWGAGVRLKKSHAQIGLDMRVISVRDARIISARTVEGKSQRWKVGIAGGGIIGSVAGGAWFEAFKNTPLEEATRDLLAHAVSLLVEDVRRYAATGALKPVTPVSQPPSTPPVPAGGGELKRPSLGGLKRAEMAYKAGPKLIWQENFSQCDVVPETVKVIAGSAECVEFRGQKWLAGVKERTEIVKDLPSWNIGKDWALEFKFYISGTFFGDSIILTIGKKNSPYYLVLDGGWEYSTGKWSDKPLPGIPKPLAKGIHHIALQKKGDKMIIFFNGRRVFTTKVESMPFLAKRLYMVVGDKEEDISAGKYVLVSDIRLSEY